MPHIHEKIDFTADVFVVYKDKVLIRKHDKYDKWLAAGGHIELDEGREQSKGYKWFSMDDLKQNIEGVSESILFYATKALDYFHD